MEQQIRFCSAFDGVRIVYATSRPGVRARLAPSDRTACRVLAYFLVEYQCNKW